MKIISASIFIGLILITGLISSCHSPAKPLKAGLWRGVISVRENEIPFLFEVKGGAADSTSIFLINGEDRFELKKVVYSNDSVSIPIDLYDVVLKGKLTENSINGQFIKGSSTKKPASIPFNATYGALPRFPQSGGDTSVSLAGTWDVDIISGDNTAKTVGNFTRKGDILTGSILEPTGDYRFLEGVMQGKRFSLSTFGGSSPYLVKGEFVTDSTFTGEFVTLRQTSRLEGKRNPKATLPDPYSASHLKEGYSSVEFSFPNLEGKLVSLSDARYMGKAVIVTILGSWCPNCLDENAFLSSWYKLNHQRGVEIIGLGFERKDDFESAKRSLSSLKNRLGIDYEILFAGKSGTDNASKALPALSGISAFPTTIFIDKKGKVRKVHTGFNGPATGKFYEDFKVEFNGLINSLAAEQ